MTRRLLSLLAVAAAVTVAVLGIRAAADTPLRTPAARAALIEAGLRCPTCQGQSVAESTSPIATGMQQIIAEQIAAGSNDAQIRAYFVGRYGDWVLLDPPRRGLGWLLWLAPGALLVAGGAAGWRVLRRPFRGEPSQPAAEPPADPAVPSPESAGAATATGLQDAVAPAPRHRPRARRGPVYAGVAVVFLTGAGALVVTNVTDRAPGTVATGSSPQLGAGQPAGIEQLQRATRQRPTDPAAWLRYGAALEAAGRPADAYPAYQEAVRLAPNAPDAVRALAGLLVRGGSPKEAVPLLRRLDTSHPDDPQTVLMLGLAQHAAGDPAAAATLRRYLQLVPDSPIASQVRGLLSSP